MAPCASRLRRSAAAPRPPAVAAAPGSGLGRPPRRQGCGAACAGEGRCCRIKGIRRGEKISRIEQGIWVHPGVRCAHPQGHAHRGAVQALQAGGHLSSPAQAAAIGCAGPRHRFTPATWAPGLILWTWRCPVSVISVMYATFCELGIGDAAAIEMSITPEVMLYWTWPPVARK